MHETLEEGVSSFAAGFTAPNARTAEKRRGDAMIVTIKQKNNSRLVENSMIVNIKNRPKSHLFRCAHSCRWFSMV